VNAGTRAVTRGAAVLLSALLLAGCGLSGVSLERLPAPHGVSGPSYGITAQFDDVGTLTVGAKVKLQGAIVGEVDAIRTRDFRAEVSMRIGTRFRLPAGSTFQIRFTTPLGEDFVAVAEPANPSGRSLGDGALVPLGDTSQAPTVEDTFAALSLLLNGGGLGKLQTIAHELGLALHGNTGAARGVIDKLDAVVTDLHAHSDDITRALDALQQVSTRLDASSGVLEQALAEFPDTLALLAQDTGRVRALLGRVSALGDTVRDLLARGQDALLADLDALRPTVQALADSSADLVPTFNTLIRFGELFDRATPGDYLNLAVTVQLLFDAPAQRPQPQPQQASDGTNAVADALRAAMNGGRR
jgi:phospholipid/cholesterol/gamma-HCH transport system substrate-binding protein